MRGALILAIAISTLGCLGVAAETGPSGGIDLEATFTYDGFTWDTLGAVTLRMGFGGSAVVSRTEFSLSGFQEERLTFDLGADAFLFQNVLVFDPCFSRYSLGFWGDFSSCDCGSCNLGFDWGSLLVYGNLAEPCQTPEYTLGFLIKASMSWQFDPCCGRLRAENYLAFGLKDIYNLIDADPRTDITLTSGVSFEEDLLRFLYQASWISLEGFGVFDPTGFVWGRAGVEFLLAKAFLIGGRVWVVSPFTFSRADLVMGLEMEHLRVRSVTAFDAYGFYGEEFRLRVGVEAWSFWLKVNYNVLGLVEITTGLGVSW